MKLKSFAYIIICLSLSCSTDKSSENELKKSPEEIASLITADLLSRQDFMLYEVPEINVSALHYAEVCTAYGALQFAAQLENKLILDKLITRYDSAANLKNTANHVDANVYGALPLEMFIQTKDQKYLEQGLAYADGQWNDTLPGGLSSQTRYWIDDIYMISFLQVEAYRATGKMVYLERAALEIDSYIKRLQQPNGLFFHGTDAPFYWGRGNGWVAAGFAELLSELPESNPHFQSILNAYKKMMRTLVENQSEDGMWHQLIDKSDSFKETSSTAMFGFAMALGVKKGLLPKEPYMDACMNAWNALVDYINEDGKIRDVCVGTGQSKDIAYYLNRPKTTGDLHGQAPMLWFANVLKTMK